MCLSVDTETTNVWGEVYDFVQTTTDIVLNKMGWIFDLLIRDVKISAPNLKLLQEIFI